MGGQMPKDTRHSLFCRWVWRQIHEYNSSVNILVVGNPGSGKSWTCTQLGYLLDRGGYPEYNYRYDIKENVAFTDSQFKAMVADTKLIGRVNQWEEVGVGAGARNWQKAENIETSQLFQIMRHNRGINLVNVPNKSMADKHIRSTSHALIIVKGHNKYVSYGRIYWIDIDHLRGEGERVLYKQLRFDSISGKYKKFEEFICLPPNQSIREEYELMHKKWKKEHEKFLAEEARKREEGEDEEMLSARRVEEAVSTAKSLIEQGKMGLLGKNKIARAVLKYELGLKGLEVREAAQLIENALATGEIQPGAAQ